MSDTKSPETLHSTSYGWAIEARWNDDEPKEVLGRTLHRRWVRMDPIAAQQGVPRGNRFCMPSLVLTHLHGYSAAQALRWWLHAIADSTSDGHLLETRLVKHEIVLDVKHTEISADHEVQGSDRP